MTTARADRDSTGGAGEFGRLSTEGIDTLAVPGTRLVLVAVVAAFLDLGWINTMAGTRGVPAGQIYASLEKSKRLGELERAITEEKVFNFLLKQSTVEEVTS